jgi:tetratricopeptide (TPR) repeat protein
MGPRSRFVLHTILILNSAIVATCACSSPVQADEAEDHWQRGEELYETHHLAPDRFDQALEWYEKAVALRPDDYELLWELSKRYQIYGQALGKEQQKGKLQAWRKGVEYGRRAVRANPNGKEGHFYYMANIGAIAQSRGTLQSVWRFRKIKREMDRTLEIDPDYPPALLARAQLLMEMPGFFGGDKQEALRLCERVIRLDPDHLPTYIAIARILASEGRYDEAIENLNKVLTCEEPRQLANYLKVDRPRAEAVLREIMQKKSGSR